MALASRVLLLFAIGLSACADDPPPAPTDWRTASIEDSTGAIRAAFAARDAEGDAPEGRHFPPSIFFRCDGGQRSIYVNGDMDLEHDTVSVTYAMDDLPERTELWRTSSDHTALGRWADSLARPMFQELLQHDQFRVSIETASGLQSWVFSLEGLEEASAPLREACDA